MLEENCISLAKYRMETSMETLNVARECLENKKESKVIMMIFLLHRKKKLKNNLIMQRV